jgi:hypothetical protein
MKTVISCNPEAFALRQKISEEGCETCAIDEQNYSGVWHKM